MPSRYSTVTAFVLVVRVGFLNALCYSYAACIPDNCDRHDNIAHNGALPCAPAISL